MARITRLTMMAMATRMATNQATARWLDCSTSLAAWGEVDVRVPNGGVGSLGTEGADGSAP